MTAGRRLKNPIPKGFTLVEMAILVIIFGVIISFLVPRELARTNLKVLRTSRQVLTDARNEAIGYVLAGERCMLPGTARDLSMVIDAWNEDLELVVAPGLAGVDFTSTCEDADFDTGLDVTLQRPDGSTETTVNVAFVLVSLGTNKQTDYDLTGRTLTLASPGMDSPAAPGVRDFDDLADWVRWSEIQPGICAQCEPTGAPGPIAQYDGDAAVPGADGVTDQIGSSDGTLFGDAAQGDGSADGSSYSFVLDGSGDYIELSDGTPSDPFNFEHDQPFAFSLWVRFSRLSAGDSNPDGHEVLFAKYKDTEQRGYQLARAANNQLRFTMDARGPGGPLSNLMRMQADDTLINGNITPEDVDTWRHVVVTYSGNSTKEAIRIYVDGEPETMVKDSGALAEFLDPGDTMENTSPLQIGARKSSDTGNRIYFDGAIDDFQVFDQDLTAQDVRFLFEQGTILHLRADSELVNTAGVAASVGEAISLWGDLTPNSQDAIQPDASAQPLLVANGIGGRPAIEFDGSSQFLVVNPLTRLRANYDYTIISVARPDVGPATNPVYSATRAGAADFIGFNLYYDTVTGRHAQHDFNYDNAGAIDISSPALMGTPYYVCVEMDTDAGQDLVSPTFRFYDQTDTELDSDPGATQLLTESPAFTIGADNDVSPATFFQGQISEIKIFPRSLHPTTRAQQALEIGGPYGF